SSALPETKRSSANCAACAKNSTRSRLSLPKQVEAVALTKTHAIRLLDKLGISYELRSYDVDESDLSAESVARKVGLPAEQVYKTLCCRGDRHGVCLALIAGDEELDLKA